MSRLMPWKYGRGTHRRRSDGRLYVTGRDGSCVPFARAVLSAKIGRELRGDEQAHHVNGDCTDDRPDNLELVTAAEHQHLHGHSWNTSRWAGGACSECGCSYDRRTKGCTACGQRHRKRLREGLPGVPA